MLSKLIGQEFKVTSRYFVPLYICLGVITLLLKLSLTLTIGNNTVFYSGSSNTVTEIINVLLIMLYVIILIGIVLLTYFIIIRRFYTNMFSDEGYLMFTLPVTTGQLLNSKLIVAFIWQFLMIPATLLSFFILFVNTDIIKAMPQFFSQLSLELHTLQISGFSIGLIIVELIAAVIVQLLGLVLMCYLSITLGQHLWAEHRLIGSILAFLGIYTVESLISSFAGIFIGNALVSSAYILTAADAFSYFNRVLPLTILSNIILVIIYYVVTHYMLNKKLNLN
ncbi:MAG: hypothetical protein Q4B70_05685 [Lachnospiraceae bacterium]|nr:hypothetical protein [Lachnospiraceae bacterium]